MGKTPGPYVTVPVDQYVCMKDIVSDAEFLQASLAMLAAAKDSGAVSSIVKKPSFQSAVQRMQLMLNKWRIYQ